MSHSPITGIPTFIASATAFLSGQASVTIIIFASMKSLSCGFVNTPGGYLPAKYFAPVAFENIFTGFHPFSLLQTTTISSGEYFASMFVAIFILSSIACMFSTDSPSGLVL